MGTNSKPSIIQTGSIKSINWKKVFIAVTVVAIFGGICAYTGHKIPVRQTYSPFLNNSVSLNIKPSVTSSTASLTPTPYIYFGWNNHDYPKFMYSFNLPSDYTVGSSSTSPSTNSILQLLNLNEANAASGPNSFVLSVDSRNLNTILQELTSKYGFYNAAPKTINGREWTVVTLHGEYQYLIQNNSYTYTLDGRNVTLLEQILTTFNFS